MRIAEFAAELQRGGVRAEVIVEPHRAPLLQVQLNRLAGGGVDIVERVIGEAVDVVSRAGGVGHHAAGRPLRTVGIAIESADVVATFPTDFNSLLASKAPPGLPPALSSRPRETAEPQVNHLLSKMWFPPRERLPSRSRDAGWNT